jgi:hypothetical protein
MSGRSSEQFNRSMIDPEFTEAPFRVPLKRLSEQGANYL